MSTTIFKILPLCAALALTGCVNLAPDHERPAAPVEQAWPTGEAYDAASVRSEALPEWQRSELFPTVAAAASNAGKHTPASVAGTSTTTHTYTAQLAMTSYELDFFGRVRNLNEQALQAYLASEDARRSAQSALIAQVASGWLALGADRAQLELQKETLASQEESFRLIEESYRLGAASRLDYEQARTTVTAARAQIASYIRAVAQDKNALDLLCGTPSSRASRSPPAQAPRACSYRTSSTRTRASGPSRPP